jgi:proteic killer suppression protein
VIISFADHGTADIFEGIASLDARRTCPEALWVNARIKLDKLAKAARLGELATPAGSRLEKLRGDRSGQWSVRINGRYRICFAWEGNDAHEVEIVDYHR